MGQLSITHLKEPGLLFGAENVFEDPKIGIRSFGPYYPADQEEPSPMQIKIGIIGTGKTIDLTKILFSQFHGPIIHSGGETTQYPTFPGFSRSSPYQCDFLFSKEWLQIIASKQVDVVKKKKGEEIPKAAFRVFAEKLEVLSHQEPKLDVIIFAKPTEFDWKLPVGYRDYRVIEEQLVREQTAREKIRGEEVEHEIIPELDQIVRPGFRQLLKTVAMKLGIPIQIIREQTLRGAKDVQDKSLVAWNLCNALYYKAGGFPWRLQSLEPNICFIGIAFYRDKRIESGKMHSAMVQLFTSESEAYVIRGDPLSYEARRGRSPKLDEDDAKQLISKGLSLYRKHHGGRLPSRVVIHKTSKFDTEESEGFLSALEGVERHDFVAFRPRQMKLLRAGHHPPIRGSMVALPDDSALLYTIGYIPFFGVYPGHRIPHPVDILIQGDSGIEINCREILALTKMNWNNTEFSTRLPITIEFSRKVADILKVVPTNQQVQSQYRFYM